MGNVLDGIKRMCKERGISLRQLEQACDLAPRYVYKWGTSVPGIDKVEVVADYFGVSIDELIGRQAPGVIEPEQHRLLVLFAGLNADGQTAAIKQLEFLALQPEYIKSDRAGQALAKMES